MGRKHVALQRRVARVLASWNDPHDTRPYPELDIVQHVDVAEDGEVNLTVRPARIAPAVCSTWMLCGNGCSTSKASPSFKSMWSAFPAPPDGLEPSTVDLSVNTTQDEESGN